MLDYRISSFLIVLLTIVSAKIPNFEQDLKHKGANRRANTIVCIHGEVVDSQCECEAEYVGDFCEKKVMCDSYFRYADGKCRNCMPHYTGDYCENIECVNGEVSPRGTDCICNPPYIGEFCTNLTTTRVYSYYNNKMYQIGPLGALALIPMCLTYWWCEKMAKKREVKRIGTMLGGQNVTITDGALRHLLRAKAVAV